MKFVFENLSSLRACLPASVYPRSFDLQIACSVRVHIRLPVMIAAVRLSVSWGLIRTANEGSATTATATADDRKS